MLHSSPLQVPSNTLLMLRSSLLQVPSNTLLMLRSSLLQVPSRTLLMLRSSLLQVPSNTLLMLRSSLLQVPSNTLLMLRSSLLQVPSNTLLMLGSSLLQVPSNTLLMLRSSLFQVPSSGPNVYRNLTQVLKRMWNKDLEVWRKVIKKWFVTGFNRIKKKDPDVEKTHATWTHHGWKNRWQAVSRLPGSWTAEFVTTYDETGTVTNVQVRRGKRWDGSWMNYCGNGSVFSWAYIGYLKVAWVRIYQNHMGMGQN